MPYFVANALQPRHRDRADEGYVVPASAYYLMAFDIFVLLDTRVPHFASGQFLDTPSIMLYRHDDTSPY